MTRIRSIEAWTLPLPLARTVTFGPLTYTHREYTVMRVTDDEGAQGAAWGMTRQAPLTETAEAMAGLALDADLDGLDSLWDRLYAGTITYGQRGLSMRALSLIDIAAWDLQGRRAQRPVWALLGGARRAFPVSVGGGYFREQREKANIRAELESYVNVGFRHVKVPGGGLSVQEEDAWIGLCRAAVGAEVELAVDAHWTWNEVESARQVISVWEAANLAWVEDPLWPEAVEAHASLRALVRTPIAVGDEQSGRWAYMNLLDRGAADIWRVDATTVGGFTEAKRVAAIASAAGIPLSTHVYPEIHQHLAASEPGVLALEWTDPAADIDLCHRFLTPVAAPANGQLTVTDAPGLGVEVDWELVAAEATRAIAVSSAP